MIEAVIRDNLVVGDFAQKRAPATRITGQAGSGKATRLVIMIKELGNPLVLCYTNKACGNIRETFPKDTAFVQIFDSYFSDRNYGKLKGKDVFIDEYSMVPNKWKNVIYDGFK